MTASSTYATRPASLPGERDRVLAVWEGTLGERGRMIAKFSWFYENSPTGVPLALLLEWRSSPEAPPVVIGVATAGRRRFQRGNQLLAAGVLVDMAVRAEHRTLGPALQLQKGLLAEGLRNVDFLYGFPNPKAAPVFQRAGYKRLGAMRRHVRVLRASGYLSRRMPALAARMLAPFADLALRIRLEFQARAVGAPELEWKPLDALAAGDIKFPAPSDGAIAGVRTAEFLVWRFAVAGAMSKHHIARAALPEGPAYWILDDQGKVLQVRDCAAVLLEPQCSPAWWALFRDAIRRGFHSVSFECLASDRQQQLLRSLGMTVRSERPVFWSGMPSAPQVDHAEFFLTSADEDE